MDFGLQDPRVCRRLVLIMARSWTVTTLQPVGIANLCGLLMLVY